MKTTKRLRKVGEVGMDEKEALTRVKTGNFNSGRGFDMQLLVDAVGIIDEMLKSGQISEVVHCKNGSQMKRPKETFWDSLSEADLMEPMHHFED